MSQIAKAVFLSFKIFVYLVYEPLKFLHAFLETRINVHLPFLYNFYYFFLRRSHIDAAYELLSGFKVMMISTTF